MIFPSLRATSRQRSFSISPVGPIVPVSCPPWPASITMRPIFSPSARVNVDCPSRVGTGVTGGCTRSGFEPEPAFVFLVFNTFTGEGMGFGATGAGAVSSTGPIGSGFSLATGAFAAHPNLAPQQRRRRPGRVQVKINPVRIRQAPGNILHRILEIDHHFRPVGCQRAPDMLHGRHPNRFGLLAPSNFA